MPQGAHITPELAAKAGRASSRLGIVNKRSLEVKNKMEELGVDPVMFLALTVNNDIKQPLHPFLFQFLEIKRLRKGKPPTPKQWEELCKLAEDAQEDFRYDVPLEQRQKAAVDLLPYIYPKLKHIEVDATHKHKFPGVQLSRVGDNPKVINPDAE